MEHILFEAQLYNEILIFKEMSNFGYTDHSPNSACTEGFSRCCLVPWSSHIWSRGGCRGAAAELPRRVRHLSASTFSFQDWSGSPVASRELGDAFWESPDSTWRASWESPGSLLRTPRKLIHFHSNLKKCFFPKKLELDWNLHMKISFLLKT